MTADQRSQSFAPRPLLLGVGCFPEPPGGGLDRYVHDLREALAGDGKGPPQAVLVCDASALPDGVLAGARSSQNFATRLWRYALTARAASRDADVVDAHFALYCLAGLLSSRLRRLPLVVHFHGPWAQEGAAVGEPRFQTALKGLLERFVYRRADRLITLSVSFKRLLVESYGVDPWKVEVVRPGTDLQRFVPGDRSDARRRLGLSANAWVALAARRLVPRTGVDILLEAWGRMSHDGSRCLVIVGDGDESDRLRCLAESLGIQDSVRFLGRVADDELVTCYQAADLAVVPSRSLEGFGLVVLEALASGLPVLLSKVGGLVEAVVGLQEAVLVEPNDPKALSNELDKAARRQPDSSREGNCRRFAEKFSWSAVAAAHRDIYRDAFDRQAPAGDQSRIVYLDHTARPSGGELALLRTLPCLPGVAPHVILAEDGSLADRLQLAGLSVEVRSLRKTVRDVRKEQLDRVSPGPVIATVAYAVRLAITFRRLRPDLVHTNSLKSSIYGGLAARLAGVPVVWQIRDRVAPDYLPKHAVWLLRLLCRVIPHGIIVDSQVVASTLPRLDGRVHVIPSPVPALGGCRSDASNRPFRVAMIGRLSPWKGQTVFLEAFAKAFPGGEERAVIAGAPLFGEEAYEATVSGLVGELGLADRVEMLGHVDDVTEILSDADVLVHASVIPEPFGMVVLEGMSAGVAVVAAAAGGPSELIRHRQNGMLYEPGSSNELARCLCELRHDLELRCQIAANGQATAVEYRPERIGPRIVDAYSTLLANKDRRSCWRKRISNRSEGAAER